MYDLKWTLPRKEGDNAIVSLSQDDLMDILSLAGIGAYAMQSCRDVDTGEDKSRYRAQQSRLNELCQQLEDEGRCVVPLSIEWTPTNYPKGCIAYAEIFRGGECLGILRQENTGQIRLFDPDRKMQIGRSWSSREAAERVIIKRFAA